MGCDLGNPGAAIVLSDEALGKPRLLRAEAWASKSKLGLAQLIVELGRKYQVELIAMERPFTGHGDNRPKVGLAQSKKAGAVELAAEALQVRVLELAPQTVKAAVAGHGRADKRRVARCMQFLINIESDDYMRMTEHTWDAAAIALVALTREKADRRMAALGIKPTRKRERRRRVTV
jgi:Holliday junction resolvasome RuvABC endonuclease subunit